MTHSPEPWTATGYGGIEDSTSEAICAFTGEWGEDVMVDADAERITSCVNALAGIANPERFMDAVSEMRAMFMDNTQYMTCPGAAERIVEAMREPK